MWKAFKGKRGWYVAWVDERGYHTQPFNGDDMTEREAQRLAKRMNREDDKR